MSPNLGPCRDPLAEDLMPPLRRPRGSMPSPPRTPREDDVASRGGGSQCLDAGADSAAGEPVDIKPIKPKPIKHTLDRLEGSQEDGGARAAASLVPKLTRPEYWSSPSIEAMSQMSELQLSRVDNLEIGHYGCGSVQWPGLTDVRRLDFDADVTIGKGTVSFDGEELNKEIVITLNIRPSKLSPEAMKAKFMKLSESMGGKLISCDMDKWIFHKAHTHESTGG